MQSINWAVLDFINWADRWIYWQYLVNLNILMKCWFLEKNEILIDFCLSHFLWTISEYVYVNGLVSTWWDAFLDKFLTEPKS